MSAEAMEARREELAMARDGVRVRDQWVWIPLGEIGDVGALSRAAFSAWEIARVAAQEAQGRLHVTVTPVQIEGVWRLYAVALPQGSHPWDIFVRV